MISRSLCLTLVTLLVSFLDAEKRLFVAATDSVTRQSSCFPLDPQDTIADRINAALSAAGSTGYSLQLCPDTQYPITSPIKFGNPNQEIKTQGFPGLDLSHRATLFVNGPINGDNTGHTVAVDGSCNNCLSVALRYVKIDGNRGAGPLVGGANIEFGAGNQNQVIEYVQSKNPRGWSCLHVAEGPLTCANVLIQNNDIGPCGSDKFQEWADGISLSCRGSTVFNNTITGATDGGIVIFGSPGSHIYDNTIRADNAMQLGGINMVDYDPWSGDYTGTVVENNQIFGGFATSTNTTTNQGENVEDTFIKIGIAMGARCWFGDKFGMNENHGAVVRNNSFQGAFGYVMAASVLRNFTVLDNTVGEDVTYIGSVGPNCSTSDATPTPEPFVFNSSQIFDSQMDQSFVDRDADSLTCILPDNDDYWPYVPTTSSSSSGALSTDTSLLPSSDSNAADSGDGSKSSSVAMGVGITFGIIGAAIIAIVGRHVFMRMRRKQRSYY